MAHLNIAVAFDLNFKHSAEIFSGVTEYLEKEHRDWRLVPLNFGFEPTLIRMAESGTLSGAIGTFVSDSWIESLTRKGVAAVNLFNFSKIVSVPSIRFDDYRVGCEAAAHLREQGATRFLFYGPDSIRYTQLRKAGFADGVGAEQVAELHSGPPLEEQLLSSCSAGELTGIFCSSDRLARQLILAAQRCRIELGKRLLVVAVDNDPSESIFAGTGISSFDIPSRESGYHAAAVMDRILSGLEPDDQWMQLRMPRLYPRESSLASTRARAAHRALNQIREEIADPLLDVNVISRDTGVSRRALEIAFQEQFGSSPYRKLSELRGELARKLLRETGLPVMEVGRRCGYPEPQHFSAWFKQRFGTAPKHYRETAARV